MKIDHQGLDRLMDEWAFKDAPEGYDPQEEKVRKYLAWLIEKSEYRRRFAGQLIDPTLKTDAPTPLDERKSAEDRVLRPLLDEEEKVIALVYHILRKAKWDDAKARRVLTDAKWWL